MKAILDPKPDISESNYLGFSELRTLNFNYCSSDFDFVAFRYFCQNSPKLEDICIDIDGLLDWDRVAKSIGPLVSRPALRTLAVKSEIGSRNDNNEVANESIMKLLKCPVEKPKLERLILSPTLPLSSIFELVKENFNLKSLTIDMNDYRYDEIFDMMIVQTPSEETIVDLIRIFNCKNGLDEIVFSCFESFGNHSFEDSFLQKHNRLQKIDTDEFQGRIYRDDFASMTTILADFLAEVKEKLAKKESLSENESSSGSYQLI